MPLGVGDVYTCIQLGVPLVMVGVGGWVCKLVSNNESSSSLSYDPVFKLSSSRARLALFPVDPTTHTLGKAFFPAVANLVVSILSISQLPNN